MITNLLVKNIALVRETQLEFPAGLNILTGETGAGKSLILGSINLALGAKAGPEVIGHYGDSAYVELTFFIPDEERLEMLRQMDVEPQGHEVVISRKILPNKSVIRINGEASNQTNVRKITELLLDIHGQHDHQSLLYRQHHLEILDRYAREELDPLKEKLLEDYRAYKESLAILSEFDRDEAARNREMSFLTFEAEEIDAAALEDGEDEKLEELYRRMVNGKRITEAVSEAYRLLGDEQANGALELTGHAYQSVNSVASYDEKLRDLLAQISNIDSLLGDLTGELADYLTSVEFEEEDFHRTEDRLNEINRLKAKYGNSLERIREYRNTLQKKMDFYRDYEERLAEATRRNKEAYEQVCLDCDKITAIRRKHCPALEEAITGALRDLNFEQVEFKIVITQTEQPTANGRDEAEFMISLNRGEAIRPLNKIASGGELSRIMLGIKSVLAGKDDIDTLIFDEIDTGISGRTAQMVSQKMIRIAQDHQVLCITHLPQIAAMADAHFLIEKTTLEDSTVTDVTRLDRTQMVDELSRMLGGLEITETVRENARQMKEQADQYKQNML